MLRFVPSFVHSVGHDRPVSPHPASISAYYSARRPFGRRGMAAERACATLSAGWDALVHLGVREEEVALFIWYVSCETPWSSLPEERACWEFSPTVCLPLGDCSARLGDGGD